MNDTVDPSNYKKIKYYIEGAAYYKYYIYGICLFIPLLVIVIILGRIHGVSALFIGFLVDIAILIGFIIYGKSYKNNSSYVQYREVHKRFEENGVPCFGSILSMQVAKENFNTSGFLVDTLITGSIDQLNSTVNYLRNTKIYYNYTVSYIDPNGISHTTDTFKVYQPRQSNVGKKCLVYWLDGKAVIDSIEK